MPLRPVPPTKTSSAGSVKSSPRPAFRRPRGRGAAASRSPARPASARACAAAEARSPPRPPRGARRSPRRARSSFAARRSLSPERQRCGMGELGAHPAVEELLHLEVGVHAGEAADVLEASPRAEQEQLVEADREQALGRDRPRARVDRPDPRLPPVEPLAARAGVDEALGLGYPRGGGVAPVADHVDELRLGEEPDEGRRPGPPCRSSARPARRRRTARPRARAGRRRAGGRPPSGSSSKPASKLVTAARSARRARSGRGRASGSSGSPSTRSRAGGGRTAPSTPRPASRPGNPRSSTWKRTSIGIIARRGCLESSFASTWVPLRPVPPTNRIGGGCPIGRPPSSWARSWP